MDASQKTAIIVFAVIAGMVLLIRLLSRKDAGVAGQQPGARRVHIDPRIAELRDYVGAANQMRAFPTVSVPVMLLRSERGFFAEAAVLSEMRSHRYSTGGSVRVAKGLWLGGRQYHSYQQREAVDRGTLVVTTHRLVFVGAARSVEIRWRDMLECALAGLDGVVAHSRRRQAPLVAQCDGAARAVLLIRLMSSGSLPEGRIPDGVSLSVVPGEGGGFTLDLKGPGGTAAIAG